MSTPIHPYPRCSEDISIDGDRHLGVRLTKNITCPYRECGYLAEQQGHMYHHIREQHLKKYKYKCFHDFYDAVGARHQCAIAFKEALELAEHRVNVHGWAGFSQYQWALAYEPTPFERLTAGFFVQREAQLQKIAEEEAALKSIPMEQFKPDAVVRSAGTSTNWPMDPSPPDSSKQDAVKPWDNQAYFWDTPISQATDWYDGRSVWGDCGLRWGQLVESPVSSADDVLYAVHSGFDPTAEAGTHNAFGISNDNSCSTLEDHPAQSQDKELMTVNIGGWNFPVGPRLHFPETC